MPLSLCWSCLNHRGVDPSQKAQYCTVNTIHTPIHTHLHTHTHRRTQSSNPSFPCKQFTVPSLSLTQTLSKASALCSANPTVWALLAASSYNYALYVLREKVIHLYACLSMSHTLRFPLYLLTPLIFISINLIVCLGSVSPLWIPPSLPNTICLAELVLVFLSFSPWLRLTQPSSQPHSIHTCIHTELLTVCIDTVWFWLASCSNGPR